MLKHGILNAKVKYCLADQGHRDQFAITDAGYNIPKNVEKIDLAFLPNLPMLMEVLDGVRDEIAIEKIILAEEIKTMSPTILEEYRKRFSDDMIEFIPHSELDKNMEKVNFAIRTGQYGFHAPNVIIQVGCTYDE